MGGGSGDGTVQNAPESGLREARRCMTAAAREVVLLLFGRVAVGSAVARARLAQSVTQWGGWVAPEGRHELLARAAQGQVPWLEGACSGPERASTPPSGWPVGETVEDTGEVCRLPW